MPGFRTVKFGGQHLESLFGKFPTNVSEVAIFLGYIFLLGQILEKSESKVGPNLGHPIQNLIKIGMVFILPSGKNSC